MTPKQIEKECQKQFVIFEEEVKTGSFVSANVKFEVMAEMFWHKRNLKETTSSLRLNVLRTARTEHIKQSVI